MNINVITYALAAVESRNDLTILINRIDQTPGCVSVTIHGNHPPVYVGDRIAPHLRAVLLDHLRRFEADLTKYGVEFEPAFDLDAISSTAAGLSTTRDHEGAENAPNAPPEKRIWWLATDSDDGMEVNHFFTEAEQRAALRDIVSTYWGDFEEDGAIPADLDEALDQYLSRDERKVYSLKWDSILIG